MAFPGRVFVTAGRVKGQIPLVGTKEHAAAQAVHNNPVVLMRRVQQAGHADQGRNVQAARQDGRVRGGPPLGGQNAQHAVQIKFHDVGGREILRSQQAGAVAAAPGLRAGQTFAQAQTHGPDVLGAVAQIGIIHAPEQGAELFHRMVQCPGGADLLVLDARQSGVQQLGVAGQFHLGRDDVPVFGQLLGHAAHGRFQSGAHAGRGTAQGFLLCCDFARADAALVARARVVHETDGADGYARGNRGAE